MGRAIYPYELSDPDFSWLVDTFVENNPDYVMVDDTCLPVVFFQFNEQSADTLTSLVDYLNSQESEGALLTEEQPLDENTEEDPGNS